MTGAIAELIELIMVLLNWIDALSELGETTLKGRTALMARQGELNERMCK
ncbi:hypothetical protein [Shewanella denitrificans]|nr:hypothetical protein [Shewanella denitrificans]